MVQCPRTKQTQPGTAQDPPSAVEIHKSHTRDYRARLSAGDFPHNSITKSHQKLPHSHDTYDVHQAIIRDDDEWGQVCGETGIFVSHCRCSHFRRVWHFLLVHTIRCAPATLLGSHPREIKYTPTKTCTEISAEASFVTAQHQKRPEVPRLKGGQWCWRRQYGRSSGEAREHYAKGPKMTSQSHGCAQKRLVCSKKANQYLPEAGGGSGEPVQAGMSTFLSDKNVLKLDCSDSCITAYIYEKSLNVQWVNFMV